ncbi:MAG: hypothetical protein AB2693_27625 [Candidatus Thiodiazotropha sp.]
MSSAETNVASSFDPGDISKQNKQIQEEKSAEKTGSKEEDNVNSVKLASVSENNPQLFEISSGEMPNKTAPSRRMPHLHKLEK